MNDQDILLCVALCAAAAFVGFQLGRRQGAAVQAKADAPPDSTAWLMAGGWAVP